MLAPPPAPAPSPSENRGDKHSTRPLVMAVQLPEGAHAIVGCIVAWSIICLCASALLVWIVWAHNERGSCKFLGSFSPLPGMPRPLTSLQMSR